MNINSEAIIIFCSKLCLGEGVEPLEPKEWSDLSKLMIENSVQPSDLLKYSREDFHAKLNIGNEYAERLMRLTDRAASIAFEIERYDNIGIKIVTRADSEYPLLLKKKLGNGCPPLFYYTGEMELLNVPSVGYVGSRSTLPTDDNFAEQIVRKTVQQGYGVVTGGAKGIDSVSGNEALFNGGTLIEFLSDSMLRRMKSGIATRAVQDGKLLLLSFIKPDAGFNTGIAMMRNKFIYAQSNATIVVKSDFNKGGTWAGAVENLKNEWCKLFCWNNLNYRGNQELIKRGAIPIDDNWDGDITYSPSSPLYGTQTSLFDPK